MPHDPFATDQRISEAALDYFTDREGFIDAFVRYVNAPEPEPVRYVNAPEPEPMRILVFYGVGGIGKTTLVRKLGEDLRRAQPPFPSPPLPYARFDFENPTDPVQAYREVLLRLRSDLERGFGIAFPRFDLCLAVMLAVEGGSAPPLVHVSPTLNAVFKFALELQKNIPMAGSVTGLVGTIVQQFAPPGSALERWVRRAGGTRGD